MPLGTVTTSAPILPSELMTARDPLEPQPALGRKLPWWRISPPWQKAGDHKYSVWRPSHTLQAHSGLAIQVLQYRSWVKGLNPVFPSTGLGKHSLTTGEQRGIEKESKEIRKVQVAPEESDAQYYEDPLGEGSVQRVRRIARVRQMRRHK
jgi:hypothetical protein